MKNGGIYTLGQSGTIKVGQNTVIVAGNGSDLNNETALNGRAMRKTITQSMMLNLIDLAKENGETDKLNSYWNTYYCQNRIISADGRYYGKYCKNRFCVLCCSIRKAEMINKYLPIIEKWDDAHMVTLTVKACKADQLKRAMTKILKGFKQIKDKHRKRWLRHSGIKMIGIKSLECNFNPKRQTYNPHLHIIVANEEMAETLKKDWLQKWKKGSTDPRAQKIEKIYNSTTGLIEVIKYNSKIFTEPDPNNKSKGVKKDIYIAALQTIFDAMKGKRIFDKFGFDTDTTSKTENEYCELSTTKVLTKFDEWEFNPMLCDWENTKSGKPFADYKNAEHLKTLLDERVNMKAK